MILGITGRSGAGKGTVVDYLVERHGFTHYSIRDFISKEILRRGLPVNRDTLTEVGTNLRQTHGPGYISSQILDEAMHNSINAIIESIRSVADAKYLKSKGAKIWAVDAGLQERFKRISQRGSETDHVSLEEFIAQENRELAETDPAKMNILGVIALADVVLQNDSSVENLYSKIERAFTNPRS